MSQAQDSEDGLLQRYKRRRRAAMSVVAEEVDENPNVVDIDQAPV